jgi:hypothetical protein
MAGTRMELLTFRMFVSEVPHRLRRPQPEEITRLSAPVPVATRDGTPGSLADIDETPGSLADIVDTVPGQPGDLNRLPIGGRGC